MRRLRTTFALAVAGFTATIALTACQPVDVQNPGAGSDTGNHQPTSGDAGKAAKDLKDLKVGGGGTMAGYSRTKFHIWASQGDGCDTRDVVLKRDGKGVQATSDCKITSGTWTSPYNGKTYTKPLDLDIDHLVPLGNAWLSGAKDWTDDQRKAFANDLTRPQLIAVDLTDNRAKGDQDPSQWKPPSHDYWCTYAVDWITVKAYWKLTVTSAEKSALEDMLGTCA
jgi:uncharacterized protein DUF1524